MDRGPRPIEYKLMEDYDTLFKSFIRLVVSNIKQILEEPDPDEKQKLLTCLLRGLEATLGEHSERSED